MTENADLEFRDVGKEYVGRDRTIALDSVSFSAPPGQVTVLVGPSGCGKSTLLHMAASLVEPTRGQILLKGEPIGDPGPDRGVVFQQFALFPWKTVAQNIAFGLKHQGVTASETSDRVSYYLEMMGLEQFGAHYPGQLSGGMKQRVAIARAYAPGPSILLMDEPFGALDAQTRAVMQEELLAMWEAERTTILFVTHAVDEAVSLGGRVVVLTKRPGRVKTIIDVNDVAERCGWRQQPMDDVTASPEFNELKGEIWSLVRGEMPSSTTRRRGARPSSPTSPMAGSSAPNSDGS